jgi:hypothetical protein
MSPFLALVRKEWRDVRVLTFASALIAVGVCLGIRWGLVAWGGRDDAGGFPAETWWGFFVPMTVALYAATVAADMVGGEVASRRVDQLALLPVGPMRVWSAKATFLLLATAAFGAWCVAVQWVALDVCLGSAQAAEFLREVMDGKVAALAATCAAATLLASTFRVRGLGALLAGLFVAVATFGGAAWMAKWSGVFDEWTLGESYGVATPFWRREGVVLAWLPASVLLAAGAAFVLGRVHLGRVLRPLAIGVATLAALLVVPAAAMAAAASSVVPGETGTQLHRIVPSPDGRWAYAEFTRLQRWESRTGFVLSLETGALQPVVDDCSLFALGDAARMWDADGRLVLLCTRGEEVSGTAIVDPSTGKVLREAGLVPERARTAASPPNWHWKHSRQAPDGAWDFALRESATSAPIDVRSYVPPVVSSQGRLVYVPEPRVLATRTLPDGPERRLLVIDEPWKSGCVGSLSSDARLITVRHGDAWTALDVETGALRDLGGGRDLSPALGRPEWLRVQGAPDGHLLIVPTSREDSRRDLVDLDRGTRLALRSFSLLDAYAQPGGRVLLRQSWPDALLLLDADLSQIRRVWPAPKESAR